MKYKLASLLVAASIVTSFYFQSNNAVLDGQGRFLKYKIDTFTSFAVGGWEKYRHDVYEPWRTRLLSTMPANFMFKAWGVSNVTLKEFAHRVAMYHTAWYIGTVLLLFLFYKNPLVYLFGMGALVMYSFTPAAEYLIYPWDGPELFFWTLILMANSTKYRKHILWLIPLSIGFKETTILCCILPLFWKTTWQKKWRYAIIAGGASVAAKAACDIISGNPIPFFSMKTAYDATNRYGHHFFFAQNFHWLTLHPFNSVWVAAALMPLIMMFAKREHVVLTLLYIPFLFAFCSINEYRLFNILIPLFFIGVSQAGLEQGKD